MQSMIASYAEHIHYTQSFLSIPSCLSCVGERDVSSEFINSKIFSLRPVCSVSRSISQRHDVSISPRDLSVAGRRNFSGGPTNI